MGQEENKLKRLELLQGIVTRMAQNSFLIKGWAVTVCSALFALSAKEADRSFAVLAIIPAVIFCGMDAYYLSQERLFRARYEELAGQEGMGLSLPRAAGEEEPAKKANLFSALKTPVVFLPYLTITLLAVLIAAGVFHKIVCK